MPFMGSIHRCCLSPVGPLVRAVVILLRNLSLAAIPQSEDVECLFIYLKLSLGALFKS